ncbi:hypothetical protein SAMN05444148_2036 [Winogradskyella jejuensis]|uniref:SMI1 / KNR4 family (SUKH-1) n=2 Tax=Winogradskyella jejuensis TaxID=1089305 RepID=A0A1M5T2W4_9FLAO|nr:hypothetical protein SAMN05444148_2036 [Winogradskyella jejuensis]
MTDEGISEKEIMQLEEFFNKGNEFPQVLRELLFLSGKFCNFLDYGIYDSQMEMQIEERKELLTLRGFSISRPHYFVCLASQGLPLFLYLDEGNNPDLYQISNHLTKESHSRNLGDSLKTLINHRIEKCKSGYNPF